MCCVWAERGRWCREEGEEGEGWRWRRKQQGKCYEARGELELHQQQQVQAARHHACAEGCCSVWYVLVCVCVCVCVCLYLALLFV
jgi:hypothetical protein